MRPASHRCWLDAGIGDEGEMKIRSRAVAYEIQAAVCAAA